MKKVTLIFTILVSLSTLGYAKSDEHFYSNLKDNFKNAKIVKNKVVQTTSKSTWINEYTVVLEDNIATISIGYWNALGFMSVTDGLFFHKDLFDKYSANQFVKFDDNIFFKINNGEIDFKQLFFIISDESKKDSKKEEVVWIDMAKASKVFLKQILDVFEKSYSLKFDLEKIYSFKEGKNKSGNIDNTLSEKLKKSFFSKFKLAQNSNIKIDELLLQVQKSYNRKDIDNNIFLLKSQKEQSTILIKIYPTIEDFYEYNKLIFYFFSSYFTPQRYIKKNIGNTLYFLDLLKNHDMQKDNKKPNMLEPRQDIIYFPIDNEILKVQNIDMIETDFVEFINKIFLQLDKKSQKNAIHKIFSNEIFDYLESTTYFTTHLFSEKSKKKNNDIITRKITNTDILSIVKELNKKYDKKFTSQDFLYKLKIVAPFSKKERDFFNKKIIFGKELYCNINSPLSILIWQLNDAKYNYDYFAIQYFLRAFLVPFAMESYFLSIKEQKDHIYKTINFTNNSSESNETFMIYGNIGITILGETLLNKEKILEDICNSLDIKNSAKK